MRNCTWAPTTFQGTQVVDRKPQPGTFPAGDKLAQVTTNIVSQYEDMGLTDLLIAQRWWGSGSDIEGSSLDCLAMTALFAGCTEKLNLITAIHPGFFQHTTMAKWGATLSRITNGRWSINVTSGWNMEEFTMYGIDLLTHDTRYQRSAEFIQVLRGAWDSTSLGFSGRFYQTENLQLEPRPEHPLTVFQGGQRDAAIGLAAAHSDWMFLNGGSPERIENIVNKARAAAQKQSRALKFSMYAAPLCRPTDEEAWAEIDARLARVDADLVEQRRARLAKGAAGMWSDTGDPLSVLDTNEGYAARLIGSPDTVMERIELYRNLGIDMLHLDVRDELFQSSVLPHLIAL